MHANTSKYLGIYFKVKVTKSITSNERSPVFTVVHLDCTVFVKHELNSYVLKHVWGT